MYHLMNNCEHKKVITSILQTKYINFIFDDGYSFRFSFTSLLINNEKITLSILVYQNNEVGINVLFSKFNTLTLLNDEEKYYYSYKTKPNEYWEWIHPFIRELRYHYRGI